MSIFELLLPRKKGLDVAAEEANEATAFPPPPPPLPPQYNSNRSTPARQRRRRSPPLPPPQPLPFISIRCIWGGATAPRMCRPVFLLTCGRRLIQTAKRAGRHPPTRRRPKPSARRRLSSARQLRSLIRWPEIKAATNLAPLGCGALRKRRP